jgi:PD-(D/E)XK nuclease superfamily protein
MQKPDHTLLSCLDRCEQEAVFRHAQHLSPPQPDISALVGQIVHLGVQLLYESKDVETTLFAMEQRWGVEGMGASLDAKRPWLCLPTALKLVEGYAAEWMTDSSIKPGNANSEINCLREPMFKVLWNEGYAESDTESGIPDRAVRARDGKVYAMDLKTRGYLTDAWQRSFHHSMQAAMQIDILESVLKEPVAGFWLDAIQVGKGAITSLNFRRYGPIEYSKALRDELRGQRIYKRKRWQYLTSKDDGFPPIKNLTSCMRFNSLCPFFDICSADPADRETLVQIKLDKGEYVRREWKPSER